MKAVIAEIRDRLGVDDWDASRRLIVLSAFGMLILLVWAAFAPLEEVTRGMGKVVPSSKVQLVQAATPATIKSILVRPGQIVKQGQVLLRLDDPQSSSALGQLKAENERLAARAARLEEEGTGAGGDCAEGSACEEEARLAAVRQATDRREQHVVPEDRSQPSSRDDRDRLLVRRLRRGVGSDPHQCLGR